MALQYSTIVSIIYFIVNIIFMFGLAFYVYNTGNHKLKSRSYFKDIWNQRKIFFPLIVHFYDTATDIGVIYNWAELAKDEKTINYESVDMKTFFWCGVSFLLVYRVGLLLWSIYEWYDDEGELYYVILVLLDLYIFVVVYESFNEAQGVITKNSSRRAANRKRKEQKRQQEIDRQLDQAIEMGKIDTTQAVEIKAALEDEADIEPADKQMMIQLFEAITESMPQIVLQSVFIIRSANDQSLLDGGSNLGLILFSVLASLFSISNKFVWVDKTFESVCDRAISLKPRQSFPYCIHYWYVIRALWRLFHIFAKFAVFTLIWTILGGIWLPIWTGVCFIFWFIISVISAYEEDKDNINVVESAVVAMGYLVAILEVRKKYRWHFVCKWIETTVGLCLIIIFTTLKFECSICASSATRMITNKETSNDRILIYLMLGIIAHLMDLILYITLYFGNILMDDQGVIHHNRWSQSFVLYYTGEPFKKLIADYKTERLTGVRLDGQQQLDSMEFQVNGVWRGHIGKQSNDWKELVLDDDEYFNQIIIKNTLQYIKLVTNKENSIETGTFTKTETNPTYTLKGNFKLVDCKGEYTEYRVSKLQFLWYKVAVY
eukprot:120169_1